MHDRASELSKMSKATLLAERKRVGAAPLWEAGSSKDELIQDILDHEAKQ